MEQTMTTITAPTSFERFIGSVCLIAAPLLGLASALSMPQYEGMESELAGIAARPEQWLASNILLLVAFVLFTPAVVAAVGALSGRARLLGALGGGLVILGSYFHGVVIGYALVELPLVAQGGDPAQTLAFAEAMYQHTAFMTILLPFLSFFLGLILLAIAVWLGRSAPLPVALLIVAAPLSEMFGPEWLSPELMWVLLLAGFGWLGLKRLRRPAAAPAAAVLAVKA